MIFGKSKIVETSLAVLVLASSATARANEWNPAPTATSSHSTSEPTRSYDYAAPVASLRKPGSNDAPTPPGGNKPPGGGTIPPDQPGDPGGSGQGGPSGFRPDLNETTFRPGTAPSNTDNQRAATPPPPPPQFPPIGGAAGGGGNGSGQPPAMPQFQQIPTFGMATMGTPVPGQDLTGLLGNSTKQMANTLDGSRLTALTDSLGKQMGEFQTSLFGIMQTNTKAMMQGLVNSQNGLGQSVPFSAPVQSQIQQTAALSSLQPRNSTDVARTGSQISSMGSMTPRTSPPTVAQTNRSPSSTTTITPSGEGQRAPLIYGIKR